MLFNFEFFKTSPLLVLCKMDFFGFQVVISSFGSYDSAVFLGHFSGLRSGW